MGNILQPDTPLDPTGAQDRIQDELAPGLIGTSHVGSGVEGHSKSGRGVVGLSERGTGVHGSSTFGRGVEGWSEKNYGVTGDSKEFPGVRGTSELGNGVEGWSTTGVGLYARSTNGRAGVFDGNVEVRGDIDVTGDVRLTNADCAEEFDVADASAGDPGNVMVLGEDGVLTPSCTAHDKRVVGVVSGAGAYRPGLILDRRTTGGIRRPIALLGKVCCKVDARYGAIEPGDLLTTSPTPGHAMKAQDVLQAFGAIIGKALGPHREGTGLIPMLIALR